MDSKQTMGSPLWASPTFYSTLTSIVAAWVPIAFLVSSHAKPEVLQPAIITAIGITGAAVGSMFARRAGLNAGAVGVGAADEVAKSAGVKSPSAAAASATSTTTPPEEPPAG